VLNIEADAELALEAETGGQQFCAQVQQACNISAVSMSSMASRKEMSHSMVPRNYNLAEMSNSVSAEPPTTMMIRNMPGRYSQKDLMLDLHDMGFFGCYDFLYVPVDKRTGANVGYAFVNFIDATWAARCKEYFEGYYFRRHHHASRKWATVSVAHLQGLERNLKHYEDTAVNMSSDKRRRPVVLPNMSMMIK